MPPAISPSLSDLQKDKQKKPRHRHSPAQLVALNELYERDEHPALELRTSLAERLGMETKTVNAWFQNKRASSKKRTTSTRGVPYEVPVVPPTSSNSSSTPPSSLPTETEDFPDDDLPLDGYSRSDSMPGPDGARSWSSFYAGNPDHQHFLTESDNMPRRMRMRPSPEQTHQLRKLYNSNPHPSTEQRQALAERIGMRYQSITNWFQNQRSLAKKRKEDEAEAAMTALSENRTYSAFPPPPPANHPSLGLPPATTHPSLAAPSRRPRSPSISSSLADDLGRQRSTPRRSVTPYGSSVPSRLRRSRPEPYQLDALKRLFAKTPTPSIEERTTLSQDIGMDVNKVTNWFRNSRQTSRKHAKKTGDDEDDDGDDDPYPNSESVSRSGTPSLQSSSSSNNDDAMDLDPYFDDMPPRSGALSDAGSEEEYQEAVTPETSPPPQNQSRQPIQPETSLATPSRIGLETLDISAPAPEKIAPKFLSSIEDAHLLLMFHHTIVQAA